MHILAHRGNTAGPLPRAENSLEACRGALDLGFGLETDIRRAGGGLYLSHDPVAPAPRNAAGLHAALWREFPAARIALNVKELGYEEELIEFLAAERVARQVFLFDLELLEEVRGRAAKRFRELASNIRIAARVSDRGETVEGALAIEAADIIWLDEFDGPWARGADVARLKAAGKKVYAVSLDLHGFSVDEAARRWRDFIRWDADGICTDWPIRLLEVLRDRPG